MAAGEKLHEPIVNALLLILKANMPAALAKVSSFYNDGVPLPVVADANYYFGERLNVPEYPSIIVDFETSGLVPEEYANTWGIYDHTISVDVIVNSDDEAVLARQLARYARAIWEVLYGNQVDTPPGASGQPQAVSVIPRTGQRSPLVPRGDAFLKGWRWLCEITRYDDLT